MIKFENTDVIGWEAAIRGMRNPMNSWEKSDSCTEGEVFYCSDYCDGLLNGDKCKGKDGEKVEINRFYAESQDYPCEMTMIRWIESQKKQVL